MKKYPVEIEQDLADLGHDFRDWYKPGGGPSRMTTRRLLILIDSLSHFSSRLWSQKADRDRIDVAEIITSDIYQAITNEVHPVRTLREEQRKRRELEQKKKRMLAWDKWRRRAQADQN